MDASGRFQMEDGVKIAGIVSGIAEQGRAADFQAQTDKYLNRIGQGEKVDPQEEGFNYRAYLTASALQLKALSADQNIQKQRFEINEAQRTENQADIDTRIVKANDLMQRGRNDEALDALIPVYEYLPDGQKIKGFKTDKDGNVDRSKLVLIAEDGKTEHEEPAPDLDSAMKMALNFSKSYKDIFHKSKQRATEANLNNLVNHQIWSTKDGKEAVYVPFVDVDKTGNYTLKETWKDPQTGETLKGFDESTGKMVESKTDFRPPAYWKQEDEKKRSKLSAQATVTDINAKKQDMEINRERAPLQNELTRAQTAAARARADGTTGDTTKAQAAQRKKYKEDLELQLKPFAGSKAAYDQEGNLTDEGKTALDAALKLVAKYEAREPLDDGEKKKLKFAMRAKAIFEKISAEIADEYIQKEGDWKDFAGDTPADEGSEDIDLDELINLGKKKTGR